MVSYSQVGLGANAFSFMGGLRSTSQMVSYELVFGTSVLTVALIASTFNYIELIEGQQAIWYAVPLAPVALLFVISGVFELNRAPADLPGDSGQ